MQAPTSIVTSTLSDLVPFDVSLAVTVNVAVPLPRKRPVPVAASTSKTSGFVLLQTTSLLPALSGRIS